MGAVAATPTRGATATTTARAAVDRLVAHGVDVVFGIPGTHSLELYRHLRGTAIRHVAPHHEQGAGYAADGYARISGRPGVCILTTGPGVSNAATAAAQAYSDSVPLLLLSPALPDTVEGRELGALHQAKHQGHLMAAVTAWSATARSPGVVAQLLDQAFSEMRVGRPRPIHIAIPIDAMDEVGPMVSAPPPPVSPPAPTGAQLDRVADRLRTAGRPAVVLGGGARGAASAALDLAARLGAPVVTTAAGKGIVPEGHPLSLGVGLDLAAVTAFLEHADVVLAVGTELGDTDRWGRALHLRSLVRVDIDPGQLDKNVPAALAVAGDAAPVLAALTERLPGPDRSGPGARRAAPVRRRAHREAEPERLEWGRLMATVRRALDPGAVIVGDNSQVSYRGALRWLPVAHPGRFLYPTGYGTLGYGLPAAIGAKLAAPETQVVALLGDGGFLFSVAELLTAVEVQLPLPIVVVNNGGYEEIRQEMVARGIDPVGVAFGPCSHARLGAAFGTRAVQLGGLRSLGAALHRALNADRPTVIELTRW